MHSGGMEAITHHLGEDQPRRITDNDQEPHPRLLNRYEIQPTCTDTFGKRGREWLRNLDLPSVKEYVRLPPNVK